eukprot:16449608-Heterocapsa_arctica.AAC.1
MIGETRLKVYLMIYVYRNGAIMSVFADDLFLIVRRSQLEKIKNTMDIEMNIGWGDFSRGSDMSDIWANNGAVIDEDATRCAFSSRAGRTF